MSKTGGHGADWKVEVSSTLVTVPNVREIAFPEVDLELTDVTGHGSTGGYQEFLPTGRFMTGEITMTLTWDESESAHAQLRTSFAAGTALSQSIEDSGSSETYSFDGYVKKLSPASPQDGSYDMVVTIQPTGVVAVS